MLVYGATLLVDEVLARIDSLMARHLGTSPSLHAQMLVSLAVHVVQAVHEPVFLGGGLHHDAGCAIPEDGARVAVLIVGHGAHVVASTDDDTLVASRTQVSRTCLHGIQESRTGSLHVVAEGVGQAAVADDDGCGGREMVVGGGGCTEHQLDAFRRGLGLAHQLLYGTGHHVRYAGTLLGLEDMTSLDPDSLHDPFVGGVHDG